MKLVVFSGSSASTLSDKLISSSLGVIDVVGSYDDFEEGVQYVLDTGIDFEKILITNEALSLADGSEISADDLFQNLATLMDDEFAATTLIFATTDPATVSGYEKHMSLHSNCNMYSNVKFTISDLKDMLLSRYVQQPNPFNRAVVTEEVCLDIPGEEPAEIVVEEEIPTPQPVPQSTPQPAPTASRKPGIFSALLSTKNKKPSTPKQPPAPKPQPTPIVKQEPEVWTSAVAVDNTPPQVQQAAPRQPQEQSSIKMSNLALERNRVVLVTGDRASGVTSTACNLAKLLADSGVTTCLIDLDYVGKGVSTYFNVLNDLAFDDRYATALLNASGNISNCGEYIAVCKNNLGVIGLPISLNEYDKRLDQLSGDKIHTLITFLHTHYSTIIIDCPIGSLGKFNKLITASTNILFCVGNSARSLYGAARYLQYEFFRRFVVSGDDASGMSEVMFDVFRNRSTFVVTDFQEGVKVNGVVVSEKNISGIVDEITESSLGIKPCSTIPRVQWFDNQSYDKLLINDKQLQGCFMRILKEVYK